jgi:hypothetical protein
MVDVLANLWAIQRLDSELDTLRGKVEEIPRKIEGLNLTAEEEKKQHEATRQHIIELKKRYKLIEIDVKGTDEKISTKSGQLYSAKTNEQYKAFLKEIESLRVAKNQLEEQMIGIMEELEQAEQKVKVLEREAVSIENETKGRIERLEKELAELEAAVTTRESEREKLAAGMDRNITNVYERIRRSKRGVAVVSIGGDRCNGCLNPLPPQLLLEVGKKDRLHFCEHCGRILIPSDIS